MTTTGGRDVSDLMCFCHLRWDFVFQRPQHLMTRAARTRRVFVVEEPVYDAGPSRLDVREDESGVRVVVPHLPSGVSGHRRSAELRGLVDELFVTEQIRRFVLWYYTPMMREFTSHLEPEAAVYDCMDELSAFAGAPPEMLAREAELLKAVDVVFTGGQSLYEAKVHRHHHVHAFPSSIDAAHFARARGARPAPDDQAAIPGPRIGYAGVIDERLDIGLLDALARIRADWQFVMIGPVVKIDPASLPRPRNIHYLGMKPYADLPAYIGGWDVAFMPFALNDATRFISPTKTPEYLAAGRPVVSTPIRDVVRPYGERGLVRIAGGAEEMARAIDAALGEDAADRVARADAFLRGRSWDRTWQEMDDIVREIARSRASARSLPPGLTAVIGGVAIAPEPAPRHRPGREVRLS